LNQLGDLKKKPPKNSKQTKQQQQKNPAFFLLFPCQGGHFKDSATGLIRINKEKEIKAEINQIICNVFMGGSNC